MSNHSPLEDVPLDSTALEVGATRPAMIPVVGIPLMICAPLGVGFFLVEHNLGWWMILYLWLPIAITTAATMKHDYNAHRIWRIWSDTKARMIFGSHYYGGAAASPLRVRMPKQPRGIPSSGW